MSADEEGDTRLVEGDVEVGRLLADLAERPAAARMALVYRLVRAPGSPFAAGRNWRFREVRGKRTGELLAASMMLWPCPSSPHLALVTVYGTDERAFRRLADRVWDEDTGGLTPYFAAVEHRWFQVLSESAAPVGWTLRPYPCVRWELPPDSELPDPPAGVAVAPLRPEDAQTVDHFWPYHRPGSEDYIRSLIVSGPSAAVFDDGKPVAYVLRDLGGALGLLHVMESHRRRGLGVVVVSELASVMRRAGVEVPYCYIIDTNVASSALFERVGFRPRETTSWFLCSRTGSAGSAADH